VTATAAASSASPSAMPWARRSSSSGRAPLRPSPTQSELLSPGFCPVLGLWKEAPLAPKIAAVAAGSFKAKDPPAIRGTGYVVDCLEAALWAFHRSTSFREAALLAVNLGDDADTTGAVNAQLAGAYYGAEGIPKEWRDKLAHREVIVALAEKLFVLSQSS